MKLLVLNECYSDNIGDQAIAAAMHQTLKQFGHDPIQLDLSGRSAIPPAKIINHPTGNGLKKYIPRPIKRTFFILKTIRSICKAIRNPFDSAVIGGGQLILGGSNFPWAVFLWMMAFKALGKDTYILCTGVGNKFSTLESILYKIALKSAKKIMLRDKQSIVTLRKLFNLDASYCPDIAYTLPRPNNSKSERTCVICITDYTVFQRYHKEMNRQLITHDEYLLEWSTITQEYLNKDYQIILSATTEEDFAETINLYKTLPPNPLIKIERKVPSFNDFMKATSNASEVVSGRMHALILSHISGATPRPYHISRKVSDFANEFIHQDPDTIKEEIEKQIAGVLSTTKK